MADETPNSIEQQAVDGIRRVTGDSGSTEMHDLYDQIQADKYLKSKDAIRAPQAGIRLMRFKPGGAP